MIEVKAYSPKMRMYYRRALRHMLSWYEDVAPKYDVTPDELFEELTDFAMISLRARVNGKLGLDFELIHTKDDNDAIKSKAVAYLETETADKWFQIEAAVKAFDTPDDEALKPDLDSDDPNLESGDGNGKSK